MGQPVHPVKVGPDGQGLHRWAFIAYILA